MVTLVLAAGGCSSSSGPDVDKLESERDVPGLVEAALDGSDEAVEALRRLEDPAAYTLLSEELYKKADPTYGEYDAAALEVLAALGGPTAATVIMDWIRASYVPLEDELGFPDAQTAAALTELASDPAAAEQLVAVLESPVPPDPADLSPNVEKFLHNMVVKAVSGRYGGVDGELPAFTGPLGSDRVEQALLATLRTPYVPGEDNALQLEAGLALVNRRRDDPSPLFPLLDDPATARVYYGLTLLGQKGTEPLLVAALQRHWDDGVLADGMARTFANSGNSELESVANSWAAAHGSVFIPYCPVPPCDDSGTWGTIDEIDYDSL